MAETTNISWTDRTFNPWYGCTKVSPECANCYAEIGAKKLRSPDPEEAAESSSAKRLGVEWGDHAPRLPASDKVWEHPVNWNREAAAAGIRIKVFCASMADVFDKKADPSLRRRLFDLIVATPWLDWQLLTKRPELIREQLIEIGYWDRLPLPNVWLGFTAGDQRYFDLRWPIIREIPAVVRFCSYEPALGSIRLPADTQGQLDWLICGGETHAERYGGRAMSQDSARSIRNQCLRHGISFFFKQWGNWIPEGDSCEWYGKTSKVFQKKGHLLDGVEWKQFPEPRPITPLEAQ